MSEQRLDRAATLIDLCRLDAARAELAPVLAAEPDNSDAHAQLAYSWLKSGANATATDAARAALRSHPENVFAWRILALSEYGLRGEHVDSDPTAATAHEDEAVRAARRCVELDSWSADSYRILATTLQHRDRDAALTAIDTAVEIDPENAVFHVVRGRVLWHGARTIGKRAAAGRAAVEEALRWDPENVEALYLLGNHAFQRRRWAEAEQWLRRAAELDPAYGPDVRALLAAIPSQNPTPVPATAPAPYRASSGGGGVKRKHLVGVVLLLVMLAWHGLLTVAEGPDSPSTGSTSRTTPYPGSYYRLPPSYLQQLPTLPSVPRFPSDRWPTGWPTPRPYLTPAPPPGG
ncbi:tetratricopeptide repeat protein [Nocardia sp. IBHARD005]|uniref:tetratricopeptide repeat protein n=1 Tax=Nocardia sp. IBHARD005 TaxID=3457765 RepID=UPI0040583392